MGWIYLLLASLFEVGFTFCISKAKEAIAPHSYYWYIGFGICLTLGMYLLIKAVQTIPMGTAYAIFTGIGAVGTFLLGIYYFGDHAGLLSWLGVAFIVGGIACLKMAHFS